MITLEISLKQSKNSYAQILNNFYFRNIILQHTKVYVQQKKKLT